MALLVTRSLFPLTLAAALGCGLIAGVFFAFSTFVMRALARVPVPEGIAAMQAINVTVLTPWFMLVFLGTTLACGLAALSAVLRWQEPGAVYRLVGGVSYVLGTFGVTIACNVPWNDRLALVPPSAPDAAALWVNYLATWIAWNHVRTGAALVAALLLILGLLQRPAAS